jgi:uncharacterized protein YcsI (UPF0317 family)
MASWKDDVHEIRRRIRSAEYAGQTGGMALGHAQCNVVILPKDQAFDFLVFCMRNPKPCPVLDVLEAGRYEPNIAPGCDIRTDVPKYRVYHNGALLEEVTDIKNYWRDDLVTFLIGCSFTFEARLLAAGIPMRHLELGTVIPVFETNIPCAPAGPFHGNMVVSMRPIQGRRVAEVVQITARVPRVHGAPVHVGAPAAIGIRDLNAPDWGQPVPIRDDEVPVFWACGVTPQAVARASRPPLMITHAPAHMFISDLRDSDLIEN